jgi:hypothetical protein
MAAAASLELFLFLGSRSDFEVDQVFRKIRQGIGGTQPASAAPTTPATKQHHPSRATFSEMDGQISDARGDFANGLNLISEERWFARLHWPVEN